MLNPKEKQSLRTQQLPEDEYGLGLALGYCRRLKLTQGNAPVIAKYLKVLENEINVSDNYKRINLTTLVYFSRFHSNKKFKEITKEDIFIFEFIKEK